MACRWFAVLFGLHMVGCAAVTLPPPTTVAVETPSNVINLARTEGTRLYVPSASEAYPPISLVDGVQTVEAWQHGAGWELAFDGAFLRNRLFEPSRDLTIQEPLEWLELRRDFRGGKEYSALGWVIFELPGKRTLNEVVLYSVDTPEYPAERFGVRDVLVEVWDEPTDRWVRVVPIGGSATKQNTVEGNRSAKLHIPFQPVRSDLIRIAIRWTNDAVKTRSLTVMGRLEEYVKATVRLTEIEVYGIPESGDVLADVARQRLPTSTSESTPPTENSIEKALDVVRTYLNAFADHDLDRLMETIAPTYSSEGEDREGLRSRLRNTFNEFPYYLFTYLPPRVDQIGPHTLSVVVDYSLQLSPLLPRTAKGTLVFVLTKVGDAWLIQESHTVINGRRGRW